MNYLYVQYNVKGTIILVKLKMLNILEFKKNIVQILKKKLRSFRTLHFNQHFQDSISWLMLHYNHILTDFVGKYCRWDNVGLLTQILLYVYIDQEFY